MEIKRAGQFVYTACAQRSSSPGIAFHLQRLKHFARKATGFTGLLSQSGGAPMSRDQ